MVWSAASEEPFIDFISRTGQGAEHGAALAYGGKPGGARAPPSAYAAYPSAALRLATHHPAAYMPPASALAYRESSYSHGRVSAGGGGARISLLPSSGAGAYLPPAPPPPADPPPFKKIRLGEPHHPQAHLNAALRIDTREPVNAYASVEMLSPVANADLTAEDQSFRTTKDELLQQIAKVDREIALSEQALGKLKKKQAELELAASRPAAKAEPEAEVEVRPRRSLAHAIYADNRAKAAAAHAPLANLGAHADWPLYNQPQDAEVYRENRRRHALFRRRLLEHVRALRAERERREAQLADTYSRLAHEWLRRVERLETGQKRKGKEARNREFFEKVFPELRKQREDRERFNRVGARIKSEADLEEIMDGLQEQELEDKKMRSYAVIPPLVLDARARRAVYVDANGSCADMEAECKERRNLNVWTQTEKEIFREKYLQHPKNFGAIASYLERKSVQDCVQYYYLSKKTENYKQMLRKSRQRRSTRNPGKVGAAGAALGALDSLGSGVTTRLQRAVAGAGAGKEARDPLAITQKELALAAAKEKEAEGERFPGAVPIEARPATPSGPGRPPAPPLPPEPAPALHSIPVPPSEPRDTPPPAREARAASPPPPPPPPPPSTPPSTPPGSPPPPPVTHDEPPDTAVEAMETMETPESSASEQGDACAACGERSASTRAVPRARAHYYGLREEDLSAGGARVCKTCHCKCVRSRYTRCPVPTCPVAKVRAKRLRHLPPRWHDLPMDLKEPVLAEFQIPATLSKCCLACFKRITRRLAPHLETDAGGEAARPGEEELARYRAALREHGLEWSALAAALGRSVPHVQAFYYSYRRRHALAPPSDDDTATSSASASGDERASDTASAESPPRPPPPAPPPPAPAPRLHKDEYDSSATETADEENESPTTRNSPKASFAPQTTITVVPAARDQQQPTQPNGPAPASSAASLTVRDVMLNVIEMSLMKNSPVPPPTGTNPKLALLHGKVPPGDVAFVREYRPERPDSASGPAAPREALATLSVVNSHGHASAPHSPQVAATITPVSQPPPPPADAVKEGLVVVHIERRPPDQEPLLDLSIKKPRERAFTVHGKPPAPAPPSGSLLYRGAEPPVSYASYHHAAEQARVAKSPSGYAPASPSPHALQRRSPVAQVKMAKPPARLSPKTGPGPKGSITHGTPVNSSPHQNSAVPRAPPPDAKIGSITQGTPVHAPPHHLQEKRAYDYYGKSRQSPSAGGGGAGGVGYAQYSPAPGAAAPQSSQSPYSRPPSYGLEQRQIIMADYITSQQMHGTAAARRASQESPRQYARAAPADSPGPPPPPQRREGVIQRHTPQPHHYQQPPPGHEAFSSLVDVAVQQPSLPVPRAHHKDTPTAPPVSTPSDKQSHQHESLRYQERLHRDMALAQKLHHQQLQYQMESQRRAAQAHHQQQQYQERMERDRHMAAAIHQGRERERQMLNVMEHQQMLHEQRHAAQQQHHHPPQHHAQQQQQQQNEEERVRRERETARLLAGSFTPAAPTHQRPPHDNRPSSGSAPAAGTGAAPAQAGAAGGARHPTNDTLTAASLIDAIITHQINQNSEPPRSFYIREPPTVTVSSGGGGVGGSGGGGGGGGVVGAGGGSATVSLASEAPTARKLSPAAPPSEGEGPPPHHTKSITLGELTSSIIARDFSNPTQSTIFGLQRYSVGGGACGAGPRETPPAPKHAPYIEPVSPPDNLHVNSRNAPSRRYGGVSSATSSAQPQHLSAFDYVTNRIVEVMRSDADTESAARLLKADTPPAVSLYPFSALTVAEAPAGAPSAPPPAAPPAPPPPEPEPLMSARYEPLSDED